MTAPSPKVGDLVWHVHHDVLVEPLTEPIENRTEFIKENKPTYEIEMRLRLMKPVRGKLPEWDKARAELNKARAELDKARAEWNKASAEWYKASAELDKAHAELDKAYAEWDKAQVAPSVLKLHAKECPNCPWNGSSIFHE